MISIKPDICLTMWEVFSIKKHVFGKLFVYNNKKRRGVGCLANLNGRESTERKWSERTFPERSPFRYSGWSRSCLNMALFILNVK